MKQKKIIPILLGLIVLVAGIFLMKYITDSVKSYFMADTKADVNKMIKEDVNASIKQNSVSNTGINNQVIDNPNFYLQMPNGWKMTYSNKTNEGEITRLHSNRETGLISLVFINGVLDIAGQLEDRITETKNNTSYKNVTIAKQLDNWGNNTGKGVVMSLIENGIPMNITIFYTNTVKQTLAVSYICSSSDQPFLESEVQSIADSLKLK